MFRDIYDRAPIIVCWRSDVGVYQNCLSGVGGRDPKYSTPLNIKKKCLITAIRLATHKCPPMTEKQTKTIKCVSCSPCTTEYQTLCSYVLQQKLCVQKTNSLCSKSHINASQKCFPDLHSPPF